MNEINKYNRICIYTKKNNVYYISIHKKFIFPAIKLDPIEELLNSIVWKS